MCSTPQKHPAASVAFCAPWGTLIAASGAVENGRINWDRNEGIEITSTMMEVTMRNFRCAIVKDEKV
jgi:hypothetical protein